MKILLSAYACEPHRGSEPGVGWNWARTLAAQGRQVHVLTRANNRTAIERALAQNEANFAVSYYDLPAACRRWKKRIPGGLQLYYLLWQMGALRRARDLHQRFHFDCVQHITFVSFRQPSFMGRLGIPFLFGPVGGGETAPRALRRSFPLRGRVLELLRDIGNRFASLDPLMRYTFRSAAVIGCTTAETRARIPARYSGKCRILPAIGIAPPEETAEASARSSSPSFLFVGRLLYWKGLHLALQALAEVRRHFPDVKFKVVGEGPDLGWLRRIAAKAEVADCVEWAPWAPHAEIGREYVRHTGLVFPSLHDSGGMVVLEAMSHGLPAICLDLGGPGSLVTAECGIVVPTSGAQTRELQEAAVVRALAKGMIQLAAEPELRARLAAGCLARARQLSWDRIANDLYDSAFSPRADRLAVTKFSFEN